MTLSARVSSFFLGGLAVVLAAVVLLLTLLANRELLARARETLQNGIATLVSSAEIEGHELEWDRAERQIAVGAEREADEVRWIIRDQFGHVVDRSANLLPVDESLLTEQPVEALDGLSSLQTRGDWWLLHRRVRAEHPDQPPPDDPLDDHGFPELTFSAAVSVAPVRTDTRAIGTTAAAIAFALWSASAIVARWYCRRALAPILSMAAEAQRIAGQAPAESMRVPPSSDELETLGAAFNLVLYECRVAFDRQAAFSSAVAHQLRSPLTAILGELEVALRRPRTADENAAVLRATQASAFDLQRTVESLLMLTRLRGSDTVPLCRHDVHAWLIRYVAGVRARTGASQIEFRSASIGPLDVRFNDVLLRQLLDNLVDNALAYSQSGKCTTVALETDSGNVRISVIDDGPGIADADLPHVFESFYRSPIARAANPAGSGLGLAIAARIAEVHGTKLTVESHPAHGTRFTLELSRVECG